VPTDLVKVKYTGWDDRRQDVRLLGRQRPPAVFPLEQGDRRLDEGLPLMLWGEAALWIPPSSPDGKPRQAPRNLVFDVELLASAVPPVRPTSPRPPRTPKKSPSGLAWKVLKRGPARSHPKSSSTVRFHYTGVRSDARCFSTPRLAAAPPATCELQVIAGWTDVPQRMTEG